MISKIVNTILSRFAGVLISFLLIMFSSRLLGAEGRGLVSLLTFNITLVAMFSNIVGGGALVYIIPRNNFRKTFIISIGWNIFISVLSWPIFVYSGLLPAQFVSDFLILCMLQNQINIHQNMLLAKQKITAFNFSPLLMNGLNLLVFLGLYQYLSKDVHAFVYSLYVAYAITTFASFLPLSGFFNDEKQSTYKEIISRCFNYGTWAQGANVAQLLNYRFSYWLLNSFAGAAAVGVFSVVMAMIDTALIAAKSIATIQYANLANSVPDRENYLATKKMAGIGLLVTLAVMLVAIFIPGFVYEWIFGKEFLEVKALLYFVLPGVVLFGYSTLFAHYFSGIGKYRINTFASSFGLVVTIILGYLLIPEMGVKGACITTAASFVANTVLLFYFFRKADQ